MTVHHLGLIGWTTQLPTLIRNARDGDIIECFSTASKELAERAHKRMCPNKKLTIIIRSQNR